MDALRADRDALVLGQCEQTEIAQHASGSHLVEALAGKRCAIALAAALPVVGQRTDALAQEQRRKIGHVCRIRHNG